MCQDPDAKEKNVLHPKILGYNLPVHVTASYQFLNIMMGVNRLSILKPLNMTKVQGISPANINFSFQQFN